MKLYILRSCPYCVHVLRYMDKWDLDIELVDVPGPHSARTELKEISGQTYVPTLVDGDRIIADDDDAIIEYLDEKTQTAVGAPVA